MDLAEYLRVLKASIAPSGTQVYNNYKSTVLKDNWKQNDALRFLPQSIWQQLKPAVGSAASDQITRQR